MNDLRDEAKRLCEAATALSSRIDASRAKDLGETLHQIHERGRTLRLTWNEFQGRHFLNILILSSDPRRRGKPSQFHIGIHRLPEIAKAISEAMERANALLDEDDLAGSPGDREE